MNMANHKVIPYEEIPRRDLEKAAIAIGMIRQSRIDRVAAFGAIRRAAEIARGHERSSRRSANWTESMALDVAANEIRCAIRAAIGSDKT